jgi:hypothetical protein
MSWQALEYAKLSCWQVANLPKFPKIIDFGLTWADGIPFDPPPAGNKFE